ncbi:MAG: hypothetical protein GY845_07270 [Planctomycetes bacterium]|nr:hypothetical protein [Planctomycetota bacterium]
MKNIQIIDGAENSTFDIYQVADDLFDSMFADGRDVAFLDEIEQRFENRASDKLWELVYRDKVNKKQVIGIHGTLHLTGSYCSKKFFPARSESQVIHHCVPPEDAE